MNKLVADIEKSKQTKNEGNYHHYYYAKKAPLFHQQHLRKAITRLIEVLLFSSFILIWSQCKLASERLADSFPSVNS